MGVRNTAHINTGRTLAGLHFVGFEIQRTISNGASATSNNKETTGKDPGNMVLFGRLPRTVSLKS